MPTRDPFSGEPLVVTRLESASGNAFEGRFELGWLGALTAEQLDFVGLLLARRNNIQKLAADLGVAYNTCRNRLEDIARIAASTFSGVGTDRLQILEQLARGVISREEAGRLLGEDEAKG